jgi:hypothetical protein
MIKNILNGYSNLAFKTPEIEKMAIERAEICVKCEHNKNKWCNMCGCYLPAKIRSRVETCKLKLW